MDTQRINLAEGWKFHYGECEQAWYKGFDDSAEGWQEVTIPHDFSVTMPFSKEYSSGTGYLAGGIGWYRVRFKIPEELKGKCIRVCFDGVYKNSMVWCNSYYLGKRPSGYMPFSYDISKQAVFGEEENEISVKVDHTDLSDSRWFTGSGIYRKVYIVCEEPVHPTECGIFFKTESISEDKSSAQIAVHHSVINATGKSQTLMAESKLIDEENNEVLTLKTYKNLDEDPEKVNKDWIRGFLKNPHLWSVEDPYLYRLESRYKIEDNTGKTKKYLVETSYVGIRMVNFDPDKGMTLNGVPVKLKGVCVHHDGGVLGAAMKAEVWQRRLGLLKEAGCNAIRCSHNPHMPELYDLCDRMGFLMMDEAFDEWENPKNKWSTGHNVYPPRHQGYYEDFPQWYDKDLTAMVRRDRNHPSVIMYSIGNEVDYPNDPYCHPMFDSMTGNNDANKPEAERRYDANKPNMERLAVIAKKLVKIVEKADATRPVTVAAAFPELSTRIGFIDELDVVGYNYKEHLYEESHERFPDKTFLGSENGHGYKQWRYVLDNEYICGQFLWTGIDYLGEAHGWPVHGSTAGILTTAGIPKPEYLRRKTFWSEDPCVCILTRRESDGDSNWLPMSDSWNYREGERIIVKVYATDRLLRDDSEAVLYINDRYIGKCTHRDDDNSFEFIATFEKGELKAAINIGKDFCQDIHTESGIVCKDGILSGMLRTSGKADHLDLKLYKEGNLITREDFAKASSTVGYLYQILVCALDENNIPLKSAVSGNDFFTERDHIKDPSNPEDFEEPAFMKDFPKISVTVNGAGELAGIDSGNLADPSDFSENRRKLWNGKAVIYVRRLSEGEIIVKVNEKDIIL